MSGQLLAHGIDRGIAQIGDAIRRSQEERKKKEQEKQAKEAVMKAGQYQYRDRRQKKREFRALWIARINAAVRELGMTYSVFIAGLNKASIDIDRKVLADLAVHDKAAFSKIAEQAKASLA